MEKGQSIKIKRAQPGIFWDKAAEKLLKWKNPTNFDDNIHDLRVLGKKLRALYYFFKPFLDKNFVRKEKQKVKKAMSSLGNIRDSHVSTKIYSKIKQEYPQLIFPKILEHFLGSQSHGLKQNQPYSNGKSPQIEKKHVKSMEIILVARERLLKKISGKPFEKQVIIERLQDGLNAVVDSMIKAKNESSAASFHEWRIKTKRFYYQLSLCLHWKSSAELEKIVKKFKQIEQFLGQAHDFHVLFSLISNIDSKYLGDKEKKSFEEFLLLLNKFELENEKEALELAEKLIGSGLEETIPTLFNP
ncbi:CHAD domain-containing protein [Methylacidiphilum caldifontis]|uniref:CHAD domain-containing protein n=1 Tax=Methylacidiphilum caldifontis TaxID=2795386 RepID=UPI001A8F75AB|nr:CHAD domain-containing protein [Methylacidiphilum caldifontis]QSR89165.1 CHAD domain-containing protein [Methylacidiphilum caldifontis]